MSFDNKISKLFGGTNYLSSINEMNKALKSLREPYGLGSSITQAKDLGKLFGGTNYLSSINEMNKALESLRKPYGLGSSITQVKDFSNILDSANSLLVNKNLIEKLRNIDISEINILYSKLNNKLKPYNSCVDIQTSHMTWFSFDEFRRILMELITLSMFIMYFTNPSLGMKDLERYSTKQQGWLKEEFKKQTKELNNLYIQKNKELYYTTVRDNIVLRSNPYIKKSTAKTRLDKNINLLVLMRKDNWLNIEYFDESKQITQTGWVHIKNLKRTKVD